MNETKHLLQWQVSANNPRRIAEVEKLSLEQYESLLNLTDPLPWSIDAAGQIVDAEESFIATDTAFEYIQKLIEALYECRQQLAAATAGKHSEADETSN